MKNLKAFLSARFLSLQKTIFTLFLLFVFSIFINAQEKNSNEKQWKGVGGEIVASGSYEFTNLWYAAGNGKWWKNDENRNKSATHTGDEVIKDVVVPKGQIVVVGPGFLAKFQRRIKGVAVGAGLKFSETGKDFWPASIGGQDLLKGSNGNWRWYDNNIVDFDPNKTNGGWVPAGKTLALDVKIYNNQTGIGYIQYAPVGIEYEYWFFPREGGQVISKGDINKTDENKFSGSGEIVGKVISGSVFDETLDKWLKPGDDIKMGHIYQTGANENANINLFENLANITLKKNTKIKVKNKIAKKQNGGVMLFAGRLWSLFKGKKSKYGYAVETFNSVAAVEGTSFETSYDPNTGETKLSVFEGVVSFECKTSDAPPLKVSAGITASFDSDCLPNLMATDPSINPPAKAGWNTSINNVVSSNTLSTKGGLVPIADSHVYAYSYSNWNKANWGKYKMLGAGWNPTGGEKRTYLKFDISGIDNSTFEKASLKLYHYHTAGSNSADLGIYTVRNPWNEGNGNYKPANVAAPGELCWINQPQCDQYPVAYFNAGTQINNFVEVDITTLVKSWLNGMPNHGLAIKTVENYLNGSESVYGFYAREHEDIDKRPQLIINGDVGGDESDIPCTQTTNLIKNGSFETPVIGAYKSFGIGQTIDGWTVFKAPVDLTGNYFKSSEGKQSIDLHGTPGFGGIQQTFATIPQKKYRVIFDFSGNPSGGPTIKEMQVSAAGQSQVFKFDCTGKSTSNMGWTTEFWDFTARSSTTTLVFETLTTTARIGSYGPAIDNVKVYDAANQSIPKVNKNTLLNITGQWNVTQSTGDKGIFRLQQNELGAVTGSASWNGNWFGSIKGTVTQNNIDLTISYPGKSKGYYKGNITDNGTKISNGTANGSDGSKATWSATK